MIESLEFLSDVLGTTEGEIDQALKDGENWKPEAEIHSFIRQKFDERLHKAKTASRLEGHGRGAKESLTKKEKELKEKLGVEGNTIEDIVEAALEAAKTNSNLNPDDVKNSEVYLNEVKRLKAIIQEKESEISKRELTFAQKETRRLAEEHGLKLLDKHKFVLPEDEEIRQEWLSNLFDKLEDDQTKLSSDGKKIVVLDSNGRPKENENGTKELAYEDLLVSKAKRYFKQAVADGRESPGNKTLDPKKPTHIPEMKDINDLYAALEKETDPGKQKEIKAHYDQQVKDGVKV